MNNPKKVIMVRPANFGFNPETAVSNSFQQHKEDNESAKTLAKSEFDCMVAALKEHDIVVDVLQDSSQPMKPDAVFPNNWVSFHPDGSAVLYPMEAENRRLEIREDVFALVENFKVSKLHDLTDYVHKNQFLEGTGSIIFDHQNKKAFCSVSSRSDIRLFEYLCLRLDFIPISFASHDLSGKEIYHTNVMLSVGEDIAVICSEAISDALERSMVLAQLADTNRIMIDVSFQQMNQFACNCLEVVNKNEEAFLIMSNTAFHAFTKKQIELIRTRVKIVASSIPTIETLGGGSARCMLLGCY